MKKIKLLFLFSIITILAIGQEKVNVQVEYTSHAPKIDGVEESLWNSVDTNGINKNYVGETPTVEAYWKALWDDHYLYVLISVIDDDHWPSWESEGYWFEYDMSEVYLDVNEVLNDGAGPGNPQGSGHYQALGYFTKVGSGIKLDLEGSNYRASGQYCYKLTGEDYVIEYALDLGSFVNHDGETLSVDDFMALTIGFDVYIIDQDEGVTTTRHRAVWQNIGTQDQSYGNMDSCGTINLVEEIENISLNTIRNITIFPNPVEDYISLHVDFDQLVISNMLGKEIMTIDAPGNSTDISVLSEGIYILRAYKSGLLLGMNKFVKK